MIFTAARLRSRYSLYPRPTTSTGGTAKVTYEGAGTSVTYGPKVEEVTANSATASGSVTSVSTDGQPAYASVKAVATCC
jgi:hypothetical protein